MVVRALRMVFGDFFLAKTTGRSSRNPTMMAGAIPLASMVITLLTGVEANRRTNSTAIAFIRPGSIWWLMKLSTLRMPPSKQRPSCKIRFLSNSMSRMF